MEITQGLESNSEQLNPSTGLRTGFWQDGDERSHEKRSIDNAENIFNAKSSIAQSEWFKPGVEGLLSPLTPWLKDKSVSEILINQPGEVFIEQHGQMHRFELSILTSIHLKRLFHFIANENNQTLSEDKPLLSGNLYDGSRVQLVIPPAAKNYTLSIRRKTLVNKKLTDYQQTDFFNHAKPYELSDSKNSLDEQDKALQELYSLQDWPNFIAKAIEYKKNIVISGGTSSGKTTFLNACIHQIPIDERLITLEDTFELEPPHLNCVRLFAPKKTNIQEKGVSMQDLVQCSLRLRPDRILMGEIRGKEILDFVAACSTGHEGSMTSIHANNPSVAFMRMVQLYKLNNVPSMRDEDILQELKTVIDVIVQVEKRQGRRVISSIYFKHA